MVHYVPRNSPGTPQFLIRGSEGVGWDGVGRGGMFFILKYFIVFAAFYNNFTVFYSISRPPECFFKNPKRAQNYPKSIPKLFKKHSKIIPKRSRNDPNMSPKCISASAHQRHSRPSAHIHPSGGGRRSPRAAGCCGAPERERGVFGCFLVFDSIF